MHMADALVSPAVGGAMWAASMGLAAWSARRLAGGNAEARAPLMGVTGAFVFAAQMINFTIPMTGSSGHLGGGMILAILLGPHAAFIAMFSILAVQALFFADGGLLALGCNVFNLGFWPCFVVYPLVFRPLAGAKPGQARVLAGAVLAGVLSLQLGSFGVVMETLASGISELPFGTFLLLMQPIHLAIGIVEGAVTAALVSFVLKARPEVLELAADSRARASVPMKPVLVAFGIAAVVTGGVFSWFASSYPDGLEWSMFRTSGREELEAPGGGVHASLAGIQKSTAFLPGYGFAEGEGADDSGGAGGDARAQAPEEGEGGRWPEVSAGASLSGLMGGAMILAAAGLVALSIRLARFRRKTRST